MSQHHEIRCDFCSRAEQVATASRWGTLTTVTANGAKVAYDVCLGCIAKLRGWDNPYLAGGDGVRLYDPVPGPLLPRGLN